jgi:RNA polymerase sigma-70 factor (ECF subfamily)
MSDSFHDMLLEHLPRLTAYSIMLTRDRSAAADLLQETALRALRARDQFTPGTNFGAWMYRILRNEHFSSLRRAKRKFSSIDDMPEDLLARPGGQESHVMSREVTRAMDQLQPDQREVLVLICAGGMSYEEAAEAIGCSVGTVKSRLWRARSRIAALVMGEETDTIGEAVNRLEAKPKTRRPAQSPKTIGLAR